MNTIEPEQGSISTFYISFGQDHRHEINGVIFDRNCLASIQAPSESEARDIAFYHFGPKFCTSYPAEGFLNLNLFPRGLIELKAKEEPKAKPPTQTLTLHFHAEPDAMEPEQVRINLEDLTEYGWGGICYASAEIEIEIPQANRTDLTMKKIDQLRTENEKLRAETQIKVMKNEELIQNLMALPEPEEESLKPEQPLTPNPPESFDDIPPF